MVGEASFGQGPRSREFLTHSEACFSNVVVCDCDRTMTGTSYTRAARYRDIFARSSWARVLS